MPIYEFRCSLCATVFEVTRPREEAGDPAHCPDDDGQGQRVWNSSAIAAFGSEDFDDDFDDLDDDLGSDFGADDLGGDAGLGSGWGDGGHSHDHGHSHVH